VACCVFQRCCSGATTRTSRPMRLRPPNARQPHAANHRLTRASVGELDGVRQVRRRVAAAAPVSVPVVAHELGVDIDGGDVVDDARDLLLGVLQEVAQQRGLAWCVCGESVA